MTTQATNEDLKKLETSIDSKIDRAIDDLSEIIRSFAQNVDERFNNLEKQVDKIDSVLIV